MERVFKKEEVISLKESIKNYPNYFELGTWFRTNYPNNILSKEYPNNYELGEQIRLIFK